MLIDVKELDVMLELKISEPGDSGLTGDENLLDTSVRYPLVQPSLQSPALHRKMKTLGQMLPPLVKLEALLQEAR